MWTNPIVTLGGRAPRAMHRRLSQRSQDSSLTEAQSSSSRKGGDADAEAAASAAARDCAAAAGRLAGPTSDHVAAKGMPKLPGRFERGASRMQGVRYRMQTK